MVLRDTPSALACYETHYKVFWPPLLPRPLACLYLRLRGRPTAFLETLRPRGQVPARPAVSLDPARR